MNSLQLAASFLAFSCATAVAQTGGKHDQMSPMPGGRNETRNVKDASTWTVGTVSAEMTHTLNGFATAATLFDTYEVSAAKIALRRSNDDDIKAFASEMLESHAAATNKLKSLLPPTIVPPKAVAGRWKNILNDLRHAKTQDFDHTYATQQVAVHKEADILMYGYAKDGDTMAVRSFAFAADGAVKRHLSMAGRLAAKYK